MEYLQTLQTLKKSFSGGQDWEIYKPWLEKLSDSAIDWLEIGIGDANKILINARQMFEASHRNLHLTGVDPELDTSGCVQHQFPSARLIKMRFEDFDIPERYDVVSAVQSFYYLNNKKLQIKRALSALKPAGVLILVNWSEADCLYQLRRRVLPVSTNAITGEELIDLLQETGGLEINSYLSMGKVRISQWLESTAVLDAALSIIAREPLNAHQRDEVLKQLKQEISQLAPVQLRINRVVVVRHRI